AMSRASTKYETNMAMPTQSPKLAKVKGPKWMKGSIGIELRSIHERAEGLLAARGDDAASVAFPKFEMREFRVS
ncbi:MAG: hypothetical protein WAM15_01070, partial [Candidatus Acidiferrales bacterium]